MVRPGKWLKSLLTAKGGKGKEKCSSKTFTSPVDTPRPSVSQPAPKDKKRWSFRRAWNAGKESGVEVNATARVLGNLDPGIDKKTNIESVGDAGEGEKVTEVTETVTLSPVAVGRTRNDSVEVTAAIRIQAVFRAYLARKALYALKGFVKLQALVRGHLVRMHATETLRCMQALIAVQTRARERRIKMLVKAQNISPYHHTTERKVWLPYYEDYNDVDPTIEEKIKIVEMDKGAIHSRNLSRHRKDERHYVWFHDRTPNKYRNFKEKASPTQSTLTDMTPRTYAAHINEFSFITAENRSPYQQKIYSSINRNGRSLANPRNDNIVFPKYMANTESSRAKVRSQSAPKQRPNDITEKQTSRKRASIDGRNNGRSSIMQRSTPRARTTLNGYHYPNSIKLDKSNNSIVSTECCSTSTLHRNTRY